MNVDISKLKTWIGRSEEASDLITPRLMASFAATFTPHLAPPRRERLRWRCIGASRRRSRRWGRSGPTGTPPRASSCRRCRYRAGCGPAARIETVSPLREYDLVTRRSTIGDVSFKEGRTGPLCFVSVDHEIASVRGVALRERHNIVYREAATPGAAIKPPEPAQPQPADLVWEVETSPVFLFRYSAITFNGHRIHYDAPYVTVEEGYDGLVVHGPIQATLLLNIIATLSGGEPIKLDYRGVAPLIAGPTFSVKAKRLPDGAIKAWTEGADGRVRMEGVSRAG